MNPTACAECGTPLNPRTDYYESSPEPLYGLCVRCYQTEIACTGACYGHCSADNWRRITPGPEDDE